MTDTIELQLAQISPLIQKIQQAKTVFEKLEIVNEHATIQSFLKKPSLFRTFTSSLSAECEYILKAIMLIGQKEVLIPAKVVKKADFADRMRKLLNHLLSIEDFYKEMGGLIGYHGKMLHFLQGKPVEQKKNTRFYPPTFIDISDENANVRKAIFWGIEQLPKMCELYPVGGAADRLHLQDPYTKEELPAARLHFAGKTLLENLIYDLQAREYLYFKLYGKELITPIAMMTSHEKNNHEHVLSIFEKQQWFGRPKESFKLFIQPLVPTITDSGKWCMKESLQPLLKPGGHGVIWKLARDCGVLQWLKEHKRSKALVRQINNPIAGSDYGLLAFTGWGCQHDMVFGFASCPRELRAQEGVNILIEKKLEKGYGYALSNIEYCDFPKYGIEDLPEKKGGKYSKYSSNTNILFADLPSIEKAIENRPFPGILINLKNMKILTKETKAARLESTMQNIADEFMEIHPEPLKKGKRQLAKTFITYNQRQKTISTTKKVYFPNGSTLETPERCFYDLLCNAHQLLKKCDFTLPPMPTLEKYLQAGPSFIFRYHPALGPLYSIIAQKITNGTLAKNSELICDIAELSLDTIDLKGSLILTAKNPIGHKDDHGLLHTSHQGGKCHLKNVKIRNQGIDRTKTHFFWKDEIKRKESLTILLHGNGEFSAEDVLFQGNHHFDVEHGFHLHVSQKNGELHFTKHKIEKPTWHWNYRFTHDFHIKLQKQFS